MSKRLFIAILFLSSTLVSCNKIVKFFSKAEKTTTDSNQGEVMSDQIKFLQENKERSTVKTTASGLQYEVIKEGTGKNPTSTSTVEVHYKGTLIDGTEFDSSYKRNQTATFPLNRVIAGWTEGIPLMKEGAKYKFFIPSDLGYGSQAVGGVIPAYATLIFEVELIKVVN